MICKNDANSCQVTIDFAYDENGQFVYVHEIGEGERALTCPICFEKVAVCESGGKPKFFKHENKQE